MALATQSNPLPAVPDPSPVRHAAFEALEGLKKAQDRLQQDMKKLRAEHRSLDGNRRDVAQARAELADRRDELEAKFVELAEKIRNLDRQRSDIESSSAQLHDGQSALAVRSQQLDDYAAELAATRDALGTMQTQLSREQRDLATQRQELLQRLGSSTCSLPEPPNVEAVPDASEQSEVLQSRLPKPAACRPSDQFRKMRRDTKRRAIGV